MAYSKRKYHQTRRPQGNASAMYRKKRPIPKKKGGGINWGSVAKTAVDTAGTVAKVISMLNVEKHYLNIAATQSPTTAAPVIQLINGLQLGNTASQRQGQQLKSTNINLRGKLSVNNSAVGGSSQARIMLVYDRQSNGSVFSITDLLENGAVWSFRTMGYKKRFKVLADHTYQMVNNTNTEQQIVDLSAVLDLRTIYNTGNTGTISDIDTGSLYLVLISDEATYGPELQYQLRYRWVDN